MKSLAQQALEELHGKLALKKAGDRMLTLHASFDGDAGFVVDTHYISRKSRVSSCPADAKDYLREPRELQHDLAVLYVAEDAARPSQAIKADAIPELVEVEFDGAGGYKELSRAAARQVVTADQVDAPAPRKAPARP